MATEVKKVYTLDIQGVDSVNALKSAIEQLTEKLKSLNEQSKEYKQTLEELTQLQTKLSDAMKGVSDGTQKASDSIKKVNDTASSATESMNSMSQASQQAKQNLETMGNTDTIKGLKEEIKGLKEELSVLTIDSDKYKEVETQLANEQARLKDAMDGVRTSVEHAKGSYNDLSQQMRILKAEYHATNDEARQNELAKEIAVIDARLKEMDAAVGVFKRNVGNYKSAVEGLTGTFENQRQELKALRTYIEGLDPASKEYVEAFNRMAEITHNLSEQQEMLKYASTDVGDQLSNIRGIASNLAAGYTAVNAAMGLFGEENENVKEALLKVQQTMALVQGLQGLDGFIKRTQGLSTAMKAWVTTSKAAAKATAEDAAASAADAAAKSAEATATAGAVAPQLALNAAMKANPIGFIIGLVASLVTIFVLLKDKIMELIGGNKEMSATFDKVKAVLSGFGNVIKKSIINPIKLAIIPIKTLGKVMKDVFTGNWDDIGKHIKEGAEETAEVVKDSINVIGQFKEGYDKKMGDIEEQRRKEQAEARSKELDSQIKDLEAQFGSDQKYTEKAKKLYEEYFAAKLAMYDKDSEEYKQTIRDKWTYEREFNKKQDEEAEKVAKEREAAGKKAAEEAKKRFEDFKKTIDKYLPENYKIEKEIFEFDIKMGLVDENGKEIKPTQLNNYIKRYAQLMSKQIGYTVQESEAAINEAISKFTQNELQEYSKIISTKTENAIEVVRKDITAKLSELNYYDMYNEITGLIKADEGTNYEIMRKRYDWINNYEQQLLKERKDKTAQALKEIEDIYLKSYKTQAEAEEALLKDPTYQRLKSEQFAIDVEMLTKKAEYTKHLADVEKEYQDWEIDNINNQYERDKEAISLYGELEKTMVGYFDTWRTEGQIDANTENQLHEARMRNLQELQAKYEELLDNQKLTAAQRHEYESELAKVQIDLENEVLQHTIEVNKRRRDIYKNTMDSINTSLQGTSTLLGNVADAFENSINRELDAGKISQKEAERKFESVKKVQKAQALVNTFTAAISAFQSMASIPYVGPVLGAAAAAAAIAAGMVQVHNIDSTTLSGSGGAGSTSSSAAYQLPSVLTPEPTYTRNITNESDTDNLANALGDAVGKQRVILVESDVTNAQHKAKKVEVESTF